MSQNVLELTELGEAGIGWVRRFLFDSGLAFSHAVLEQVDVDDGRVYGYLPPLTAPQHPDGFARILTPRPGRASFHAMLDLVRSLGGDAVVVESPDASREKVSQTHARTDLSLRRAFYGDAALLFTPISQAGDDVFYDIDERDAAFLIDQTSADLFVEGARLSSSQVNELLRRLRAILVNVFDGDSIAVWTRAQLPRNVRPLVMSPSSDPIARPN